MRRVFAIILPLLVAVTACSPRQVQKTTAAQELLARLENSVSDGKIMYGHQDDLVYGHTWAVEDPATDDFDRSDVKDVTGLYPAVLGLELGGLELGWEKSLDSVRFASISKAARIHYQRGGIVTLSWHPYNPATGGKAWDISSSEAVASVLDGGVKAEMFALWLQRLGDFLETFVTDDGARFPFIFRHWHEHTGSWFWWGRDLCTKGQYVDLWRKTWHYLVNERGLDNIVWCYSPGAGVDAEGYLERWPGDEYVDIMGIDCYAYDTVRDTGSVAAASAAFSAQLSDALQMMTGIAVEKGKLMTVSECGFEGLPDANWWMQALYPAIKDYPVVYALTWRNAPDRPEHFYAPFKGYQYENDFIQFCQQEQIELL